jgi:hypothetical protein
VPEINMILKGTSFGGDSNNGKRKYRKKVLIAIKLLDQWHKAIVFAPQDRGRSDIFT